MTDWLIERPMRSNGVWGWFSMMLKAPHPPKGGQNLGVDNTPFGGSGGLVFKVLLWFSEIAPRQRSHPLA